MVKGINRHIIEINDTDNLYYERAVLFVRPEFERVQQEVLVQAAKKMLKSLKAPSVMKKRKSFFYWAARLLPAAIIGAFIMFLVLHLFYF